MSVTIGIDPGMTGGLCCLVDGAVADLLSMPVMNKPSGSGLLLDLGTLINLLEMWDVQHRPEHQHVFLERAQSFPGEGVAHTFAYGRGFGQIEGILAAIPLRYTLVSSRVWTKAMHAGTEPGDPKKRSLIAARRLFPSVKLTIGRSTVPHKGVIDAILLAEFGRRTLAANPSG